MADADAAIDWGGAFVRDGILSVPLDRPPTRRWVRRFRELLVLLDRAPGDWGPVELRRGTITVSDVRDGSEDRLRHLLDAVVVEISGDLDAARGAEPEQQRRSRERDHRMTEAFRAPHRAR